MRVWSLILLLIVNLSIGAQTEKKWKEKWNVQGYVKNMQSTTFSSLAPGTFLDNLIHNRINVRYYPSDKTSAGFEFRNRIFWGQSVSATTDYGSTVDIDGGMVDLSVLVVDDPHISFLTQIDRAWLNHATENWEWRIGRQRINWGITNFWNSNDLFNAYSFTDFDYEERPGVDALRVQHYLSGMSSVEFAIKPSQYANRWVGAMLYRFNKWQYDIQLLGGWYERDIAIGGGWAGNLGKSSFKGEVTYFHPQENWTDSLGEISASASIDYVFKENIFASVGYLYNSMGAVNPISLGSAGVLAAPVSAKNLMPAAHSILLSGSYPITPLLSASLVGVVSPGANMLLTMPSVSYSISNDWELALFGQSYWLGDYWDNLGNGIYLRIKMSF